MEDAASIIAKINKEDFSERDTRQDEDYLIWDGKPAYDKKIKSKTKAHGSDIEVVTNDIRTFCDDVQSTLASAEMSIIVKMAEAEGDDKRDDMGKLERLFKFLLFQGDKRLRRLLLPPLRVQLIWSSLVRGWMAGRFLNYMDKDGNVVADYMFYDPRWLKYKVGANGLLWTAYETFKSGEELADTYKYNDGAEKNNSVWDYWEHAGKGRFTNAMIVKGKILRKRTYNIPSFPVLIQPVSTRPPIIDNTGMKQKGYGDAIFASTRDVNATRNRFLTMWATHANKMAGQPLLNYRTDKGTKITDLMNVPGSVIDLKLGQQEIKASPLPEVSPTVLAFADELKREMAQGMLTRHPSETPTSSGTRYALEQENSKRVFNPELRNLNDFYSDMCHLIEEQLIEGGVGGKKITAIDVKWREKQEYYSTKVTPVDLKKPHTIEVEFTTKSPWEQMDTAQQAQMLRDQGLPDEWVNEFILKVPDAKMLSDLSAIQLYEHSPEGAMSKAADALMRLRKDVFAAQKIMEKLDALETQEKMALEQQAMSLEQPPGGGI